MKFLFVILIIAGEPALAAMSADSCKTKIKAAYHARTGEEMAEGQFNAIVDLCQGIIDEIKANAQVQPGIPVSTTGTATSQSGATTAPGTIQ